MTSIAARTTARGMATAAASAAAHTAAAAAATAPITTLGRTPAFKVSTGVVIRAGTCDKTVKVRLGGVKWNNRVHKYFKKPTEHLCHDPNNSLREGDVIEVQNAWRTSKTKRFVVNKILAPFGPPIDERPPVPTPEEREATRGEKREKKVARRTLRKEHEQVTWAMEKTRRKLNRLILATATMKHMVLK